MVVVTHKEFGLAHDEKDVVWIPKVAEAGYIILTKDKEIRRDSLEVRAVIEHRAHYFTLGRANRKSEQEAQIFLHHCPVIQRLVRSKGPPLIAQLNVNEMLLRTEDRRLVKVRRRGRWGV